LIKEDHFDWLGPQGFLDACAIWVDIHNTFGGLFYLVEHLKKTQCREGVFLILGTPKDDPSKWTTPFPCPPTQMK
jgi:hypothetical protein